MKRRAYSAGAVKVSFWFAEFRQAVQLLAEGKSWDEIRRLSVEENIFGASTPLRAKQIYSSVKARITALDDSFIPVFLQADVTMQKLFALAGILSYDTLFFDFVYDVLRDKVLIGSNELHDSDLRLFFTEKQSHDERAAKWTEPTLIRLARSYKTMLSEAGVIDAGTTVRHITPPILTVDIEDWFNTHDLAPLVKALTGVG